MDAHVTAECGPGIDVIDVYGQFLQAAEKLGVVQDARNDVLSMAINAKQSGTHSADVLIRNARLGHFNRTVLSAYSRWCHFRDVYSAAPISAERSSFSKARHWDRFSEGPRTKLGTVR